MKHVRKSVLLWYSAHEMFELVTAVERYPQFLPWCERAEVVERHADGITARLSLAFAGVHHAFTTRNVHTRDEAVIVRLVDGPFSLLEGDWLFKPITNAPAGRVACKIELDLQYAFASRALEAVVSPVFDRIAETFVDSFVQRAEVVYGVR
jgi:ribosome-associated toxin RatA of RatAB toxin-antitoxin module